MDLTCNISNVSRPSISLFCFYQVDEQMRQELAEWKLFVDKDKGGKTKANAKV